MDGLTVRQLVEDLHASCGIQQGDVLIVHSSMRSIGRVCGGPASVVEALIEAIGPSGTLLMPTFSAPQDDGVFDMKATPSRTGLITETLRTWPGAVRSMHPTHSVVAYGARAQEFTTGHQHVSPLGVLSPFHKATVAGAEVLMIGCDLLSCSLIHIAESVVRVPYLGRVLYSGYGRPLTLVSEDGVRHPYTPRDVPGDSAGFGVVKSLLKQRRQIRACKFGEAGCLRFRAQDALRAAVDVLREDAGALLCHDPHCAVCPASRRLLTAGAVQRRV